MITVVEGSAGFGATNDLALSVELLNAAVQGRVPGTLYRSYRPARTVAFTASERRLPGFDAAWQAAKTADFVPVLRRTGGRVAAYDHSCLVVDVIEPASVLQDHRESFGRVAGGIASALQSVDVDARVGAVPGEYCPGDFSVGARGVVKLVGVAQRVSRGFRLISSVIAVEPAPHLAQVLSAVNDELAFVWNPTTCGAVLTENPAVSFAAVEAAVAGALAPDGFGAVLDWGVEARSLSDLLDKTSLSE